MTNLSAKASEKLADTADNAEYVAHAELHASESAWPDWTLNSAYAAGNLLHYARNWIFLGLALLIFGQWLLHRSNVPQQLKIEADSVPMIRSSAGEGFSWDDIWYARRAPDGFELFDRGGTDPRTGKELVRLAAGPVRTEVIAWIARTRGAAHATQDSLFRARRIDSIATARHQDSLTNARLASESASVRQQRRGRVEEEARVLGASRDAEAALKRQQQRVAELHSDSLDAEIAEVKGRGRQLRAQLGPLRADWSAEIRGRSVQIFFSSQSRRAAAEVYATVTAAGAEIDLKPSLDRAWTSTPAVRYAVPDVHAGEALRGLLADIVLLELFSSRDAVTLSVHLP